MDPITVHFGWFVGMLIIIICSKGVNIPVEYRIQRWNMYRCYGWTLARSEISVLSNRLCDRLSSARLAPCCVHLMRGSMTSQEYVSVTVVRRTSGPWRHPVCRPWLTVVCQTSVPWRHPVCRPWWLSSVMRTPIRPRRHSTVLTVVCSVYVNQHLLYCLYCMVYVN